MSKLLPLLGGTYNARSVIASAQRCVNLYPEFQPQQNDEETPVTHYPAPGLILLNSPSQGFYPSAPGRGLYLASNGTLFAVVGAGFYSISPTWAFTLIGQIQFGTQPVSMQDNRSELLLVAGPALGYTYNFSTKIFSQISDPAFYGADYCGYLDGFTIMNHPGTNQFYSTLANQITPFDPTYFASKSGEPDNLVGLLTNHREIQLIGEKTTEIWYNAGNPLFPFAIFPGVFIQQGCNAKYSLCRHDLKTFWINRNKDGSRVAVKIERYTAARISTPALEQEWATYPTTDDAIGLTYQIGGHVFVQFNFPSADKTFVFDDETSQWHERTWLDSNGMEHRHRAQCATNAYGAVVCLDYQNGSLYALDSQTYTDAGNPITYRRRFPAQNNSGAISFFDYFQADMEVGQSQDGSFPQVSLSWSDDRGESFGTPILQQLGQGGQYLTSIKWNKCGRSRGRIFDLSWSAPVKTALNGAYCMSRPGYN